MRIFIFLFFFFLAIVCSRSYAIGDACMYSHTILMIKRLMGFQLWSLNCSAKYNLHVGCSDAKYSLAEVGGVYFTFASAGFKIQDRV